MARTRKPQNDAENALTLFTQQLDKEVAQKTKSERTRTEYLTIAKKLLTGALTAAQIRSRSRYLQVAAVIRLLHLTGAVDSKDTFGLNLDLLKSEFRKGETENHKIERIQDKVLSDDDFDRLLDALPQTDAGRELALACAISRRSGARLSEVLALTPASLTITPDAIILSIRNGKGNKPRTAFLPVAMTGALTAFTGFSIDRMYVNVTINRAMRKAGVRSSFHGLRHTFATEATQHGVGLREMAEILGHSDPKTTMIYTHVKKDVPAALLKFWQTQQLA